MYYEALIHYRTQKRDELAHSPKANNHEGSIGIETRKLVDELTIL